MKVSSPRVITPAESCGSDSERKIGRYAQAPHGFGRTGFLFQISSCVMRSMPLILPKGGAWQGTSSGETTV